MIFTCQTRIYLPIFTSVALERTNHLTKNIMVAIRLNRQGTKDRPYYKIVVVDNRKRRDGRYIEQIGTYNPMIEGTNFKIDLEKIDKWIGEGAQPSDTVRDIIKKARKVTLEA